MLSVMSVLVKANRPVGRVRLHAGYDQHQISVCVSCLQAVADIFLPVNSPPAAVCGTSN